MGKKIQCIGRYVMDGQTLGKGNFARVELATHGVTGCKVAIKILDTRKIKEDYTRNNLHREARILGQLRHPNIIRLYETLKATTLYCLILEYATGGDLLSYLKGQKDNRIHEEKARPFFRQLVSALHYLHERGVAHRDLKMDNILLDEKKNNLKVIDFGLSNTFSQEDLMKTHCGSLDYAAPELIGSTDKYGPEVDIWSLGVILYAMLVGKLPFTTLYTDHYRREKLQSQIEKGMVEQHDREIIGLSAECRDMLKKLLEPNPELRIPVTDITLQPWVTSNNKIPFCSFHHLPKDKTAKSQDFEIDSDTEEVIEELTGLLQIPKDQLEKTVHESRCDDMSAMFNMMLDYRRQEKGIFDTDFTLKQEKKPETRTKRRHHHHRKSSTSKQDHKSKETQSVVHRKKAEPSGSNVKKGTPVATNTKKAEPPVVTTKQQKVTDPTASVSTNKKDAPPSNINQKAETNDPTELLKTNNVDSEHMKSQLENNLKSPELYNIPLCFWEELVKGEHASDGEGGPETWTRPHTSTSFDLMALCSPPTWLGPERRKSRRRRSPMPPHSPFNTENGAKQDPDAVGMTNLLSPSQASSQVSALLRRNSSRRRPRRTSSADPPSRRNSSRRRRRTGTPGSHPTSPHSPANQNNPEIRIVTPKQSPLPVPRPSNLLGLKECYANSAEHIATTGKPKSQSMRLSRRDRDRDQLDCNHSDSSNPCSTTNLHETFSDGSHESVRNNESRGGSGTSIGANEAQSVESKIAATDIRSIVRPKQYALRARKNGPIRSVGTAKQNGTLHIPSTEHHDLNMSSSPEIIIESTMQQNAYANLSDDEKIEQNGGSRVSSELPRTDSEKCIELRVENTRLPVLGVAPEATGDSSLECLGAASDLGAMSDLGATSDLGAISDLGATAANFQLGEPTVSTSHTGLCDVIGGSRDGFYASSLGSAINSKDSDLRGHSNRISSEDIQQVTVDLFSKKERISLHEDISFVDSSDHNSSQENLFAEDCKRRLKESLTSEESISVPLLTSPRIRSKTTQSDSFLDEAHTPGKPTNGSFRTSSKHGSTPSVRFVMPSTPIRQMFKMPIARIESFHSDDFDVFTSDVDALVSPVPSPSSSSVQTPTVPCFQYKLHSRRKKNLLKAQQKGQRQNCVNETIQYGREAGLDQALRVESIHHNDQLFSSGSDGGSDGQLPDGDRASNASRAKIYPMEKRNSTAEDADQTDQKGTKLTSQHNDKSKLITDLSSSQNNTKKAPNSVNKTSHSKTIQEPEPAKKSGVKTVWKRGFAHLLKKKKFGNIGSSGNNNNDVDSPSRNHRSSNHRATRNGHARGAVPVSPPRTLEIPVTTVDIQWKKGPPIVPNNLPTNVTSGDIVQKGSPAQSPSSPSKTKVYDFTMVTADQPKGKPCLLSWKACRECTFSDDTSSGESSDSLVAPVTGSEQRPEVTSSMPVSNIQEELSINAPCSVAKL